MNNTAPVHAGLGAAAADASYLSQFEVEDGQGLASSSASVSAIQLPPLDMLSDGPDPSSLPPPSAVPALHATPSDLLVRAGTPSSSAAGAPAGSSTAAPARSRPSATAASSPRTRSSAPAHAHADRKARMRNTPHLPTGHADPAPPTVMYWSRAPVHGLLPSRKFRAHTSTLVDSVAWVFGGCDEHGCSRDVYCLDIETFQWSHPDLAGDWPVPCRAHTATLVDGKRIFVFGGGANADYYDSLYILDTAQRKWSSVTVAGPKPIQRRAHTAVYYKGRIWVFGGGNGVRALNDVWALDVSVPVDRMRWEQVETHGKRPSPRGYHTANLVGQNMVVVGGSDGRECFQDIWVLNLDTFEWRNVNTEKSYRRLSHCATQVGSYLFVMGGHDSQKYTNELLLFNLSEVTLQWESRPCLGRAPSVRAYQSAFLADSRLFVLGGFDGTSAFDDVHILDLAASAYLPQVTSFAMTAN